MLFTLLATGLDLRTKLPTASRKAGASAITSDTCIALGSLELLDERAEAEPTASVEPAAKPAAEEEVVEEIDDVASAVLHEASIQPPWQQRAHPIAFLEEGMPTVLSMGLLSMKVGKEEEADMELETTITITRLRLPIKPILITQAIEILAPCMSQATALSAVKYDLATRSHSSTPPRNPCTPTVICPIRATIHVDGLMVAFTLPNGQQLVSSHTASLHTHLATHTQEEATMDWEFDALLCPAAVVPAAQFTPNLRERRWLSPLRLPTHSHHHPPPPLCYYVPSPLLPQCCLRCVFELSDTYGSNKDLADESARRASGSSSTAATAEAPAVSTAATTRKRTKRAMIAASPPPQRTYLRHASAQLRRFVLLLPPAHIISLSRLLTTPTTQLEPLFTRLHKRTRPLVAMLTAPVSSDATSLLDHLPFVLPGSPALEPSCGCKAIAYVLAAADPHNDIQSAPAVTTAAAIDPSTPKRVYEKPLTHIMARTQRARIFLSDDFSTGGRNEPTVELHLPEGHLTGEQNALTHTHQHHLTHTLHSPVPRHHFPFR